jgi:multidrug resistance protein
MEPPSEARTALESRHNISSVHAKTSPVNPDNIVEKVEQGQSQADNSNVLLPSDPNLIAFQPNDPGNPFNWSLRRRWLLTVLVSCYTFISPVSSSMVAPALSYIRDDFKITNSITEQMVLSIFVLSFGIGPLILGPLSEVYGRVYVLQLGNLLYLLFNIACGLSQTTTQLIVFRFLSGLGGGASLAIGGGVLSDCFTTEQRGRAVAVYNLAPLLGPSLGPIAGAWLTQYRSWRWTFWVSSIADGAILIVGLLFLRETYAPIILARRVKAQMKLTGNPDLHTPYSDYGRKSVWKTVGSALVRPLRMLTTQPIVFFLSLYYAYIYGLMYLVLSTFPVLWHTVYKEPTSIAGLNYISLGLGYFVGSQICAISIDRIYTCLRATKGRFHRQPSGNQVEQNNTAKELPTGVPEYRIPLMVPASLFIPAGLLIYGLTAAAHKHWILPNLGTFLFSLGVIVNFQCIQNYLIDAYSLYAASAIGAATFLRAIAGFGLPLLGPKLYASLGYGEGNGLLAGIAVGLGGAAPWVLWRYGAWLRGRSRYAVEK